MLRVKMSKIVFVFKDFKIWWKIIREWRDGLEEMIIKINISKYVLNVKCGLIFVLSILVFIFIYIVI